MLRLRCRAMYERILVGTDGSATAERAVDRAVEIATATGARLTILTASASPERGAKVVEATAARVADSGVEIDTIVSSSDPATAIVDAGDGGGYDLVVLGNKGMTGARRFLPIGAVPNKVSHHLGTSLLIVRTT